MICRETYKKCWEEKEKWDKNSHTVLSPEKFRLCEIRFENFDFYGLCVLSIQHFIRYIFSECLSIVRDRNGTPEVESNQTFNVFSNKIIHHHTFT